MIEAQRHQSQVPDDPLIAAGPRKQYPLYDGHGNMIASVIRGSGTSYSLVNERRYDAWGSAVTSTAPGDALAKPSEGYCANIGHKADAESGLIYMRARYYEPSSGRFISEDPELDGINWYAYCANEPVDRIDSTGKYWINVLQAGYFLTAVGLLYLAGKQVKTNPAMALTMCLGAMTVLNYAVGWGPKTTENWKAALQLLGFTNVVMGLAAISGTADFNPLGSWPTVYMAVHCLTLIVCLIDCYILPGEEIWYQQK